MAKNIEWMGAIFPDVPSICLPQHETGEFVEYNDTSDGDITASDVAQGKIGYAQGQKIVGTATPSTPTIQSLSVTENGTYTAPSGVDGYSPVTVNVSGGGGASNVVIGTFKYVDGSDTAHDIDIPYTGNGYPLAISIFVKDGISDTSTEWYSTVHSQAVGMMCLAKEYATIAPTYQTSGDMNKAGFISLYKNSSSSSTQITAYGGRNVNTYTSADAMKSISTCARFKNNGHTLSVMVPSTGAGFVPNTEYMYVIAYSS